MHEAQSIPAEPASLSATRKFWSYLDEIPGFWRVTGDPDGPGDYLRIWAIDRDGAVTRVPAAALEGFGKRLAKDSYVYAASVWCARNRPDAVVVGMECWAAAMGPEARERLLRDEGGTPDMMVPANRERLARRYGATCRQCLILQGELRGLDKSVCLSIDITDGKLGAAERLDDFQSRFAGLLRGSTWSPPGDDGFK
jgi:PAS domain-containing protein